MLALSQSGAEDRWVVGYQLGTVSSSTTIPLYRDLWPSLEISEHFQELTVSLYLSCSSFLQTTYGCLGFWSDILLSPSVNKISCMGSLYRKTPNLLSVGSTSDFGKHMFLFIVVGSALSFLSAYFTFSRRIEEASIYSTLCCPIGLSLATSYWAPQM